LHAVDAALTDDERRHVVYDFGEVRGLDYYTVIHFEIFVTGARTAVGAGGRYDDLMGRFGRPSLPSDSPSTSTRSPKPRREPPGPPDPLATPEDGAPEGAAARACPRPVPDDRHRGLRAGHHAQTARLFVRWDVVVLVREAGRRP